MATTSFGRSRAFLSGKACRMQRRGNVLIRCVHLACDSPEKPPNKRVPLRSEARAVVVGSVYECLSKPGMARGSRLEARSSISSASLREQKVGIQARISPKVTRNGPEWSPNEALRWLEPNLEPSAPALAPTAASLDCKAAGTTAHLDSGLPRCFPPRFFRTLEPECRATRSIRSAAVCNLQLLRTFPVARKKKSRAQRPVVDAEPWTHRERSRLRSTIQAALQRHRARMVPHPTALPLALPMRDAALSPQFHAVAQPPHLTHAQMGVRTNQANLREGLCVALQSSTCALRLLPPASLDEKEVRRSDPGHSAFSLGFHAGFVCLSASFGSRGLPNSARIWHGQKRSTFPAFEGGFFGGCRMSSSQKNRVALHGLCATSIYIEGVVCCVTPKFASGPLRNYDESCVRCKEDRERNQQHPIHARLLCPSTIAGLCWRACRVEVGQPYLQYRSASLISAERDRQ